jgi:hypothetical protein
VSTISQTGGQYWVVPGSQWAVRYPKNNTVLFPFNYAIGEQSTVSTAGSLNTWGINTLPYSNYDCDNYAVAASDDIIFYTYTYRQGQVGIWRGLSGEACDDRVCLAHTRGTSCL